MLKKYFNLKKAIATTILLTGFSAGAVFAQETEIGVVINGVRWATRNLDVGGTFVENPEDYGAYFQWGRPADGHENPASGITNVLATSDTPGHDDFILNSSEPYDWRSPQNDALWNAGTEEAPVKTANDPSPDGWRVPTNTELLSLLDKTKVTQAWDNTRKGYTFTDKESSAVLFLPAAGWRFDGMVGGGASEGGTYWSSCPNGTYASLLGFIDDNSDANIYDYRVKGLSLRCVAIEPHTPPTAISTTEQQPLNIYPNPVTNGELRIESGILTAGEVIAIYNLSGAQVAVYQAAGEQTTINISQLPSGAYLMKAGNLSELIIKN